jgi:hypothetical protein
MRFPRPTDAIERWKPGGEHREDAIERWKPGGEHRQDAIERWKEGSKPREDATAIERWKPRGTLWKEQQAQSRSNRPKQYKRNTSGTTKALPIPAKPTHEPKGIGSRLAWKVRRCYLLYRVPM